MACPTCRKDEIREGLSDYKAYVRNSEITVREIPSIVCDHCGDAIRDMEPNQCARAFVESFR